MWKLEAEKHLPFFVASGELAVSFMQAVKGHSLAQPLLMSCTPTVQHACCELYWMKEWQSYHFWLIGTGSDQSRLIKTDEVSFTFFSFSTPKHILAILLQTMDAKGFSQSAELQQEEHRQPEHRAGAGTQLGWQDSNHGKTLGLEFSTQPHTSISSKSAHRRKTKEQLCDYLS